METQKIPSSQTNCDKNEMCWGFHKFWSQIILQSHSNEGSMVLAKSRHTDQWKGTQELEINPYSYSHLIFDKGVKIHIEKKAFSTNDDQKIEYP
jgi:hypothetical protein